MQHKRGEDAIYIEMTGIVLPGEQGAVNAR